jgi:L-ribulose-5-phosphate 3-epimerase
VWIIREQTPGEPFMTSTNPISFHTANYVARQLGYNMTQGWGQGDKATNDYFKPLETYEQRFEQILQDIRSLNFTAIDLWTAHLNPAWATSEHIKLARNLLKKHDLKVITIGGGFGGNRDEFEATCKLAAALDQPILAGSTSMLEKDRPFVLDSLKNYGLKLALENHPEKTPEELLAKIGGGHQGLVGAAVDTGWFGTQGYNAADAIEKLGVHVMSVHLKDVLAAGAHETCRYGRGIVPIEQCVRVLQKMGYQGGLSVEHEPDHFDPTDDVIASYAMLRGWLS